MTRDDLYEALIDAEAMLADGFGDALIGTAEIWTSTGSRSYASIPHITIQHHDRPDPHTA